MVGNFAFLFDYTLAGQTSDSMTVQTEGLNYILDGPDVLSV